MSGLQKALERHQTKLDRLSTRMLENSQTLSGLEAAMGAELAEVRRKFRAKKSELEAEAIDLEQQKESTAEKMLELRDTQENLLVQPPSSAASTTSDFMALQRMATALTHRLPDCTQVFEEVVELARMQFQPHQPQTGAYHLNPPQQQPPPPHLQQAVPGPGSDADTSAREEPVKRHVSRDEGAGVWSQSDPECPMERGQQTLGMALKRARHVLPPTQHDVTSTQIEQPVPEQLDQTMDETPVIDDIGQRSSPQGEGGQCG
eukprot:1898456-Amphidinium_carterae.1